MQTLFLFSRNFFLYLFYRIAVAIFFKLHKIPNFHTFNDLTLEKVPYFCGMKIYTITHVFTKKTRYFKQINNLCDEFNFSTKAFYNTKAVKGLPLIKGEYIIDVAYIEDD